MGVMHSEATTLSDPALLRPPRGYRPVAWIGLAVSVLAIPAGLAWILLDPTWHIPNLVVGASAGLPTAVVGVVSSIALIRWRSWGQVLAIVALSMSLAVGLSYGIVRLTLVPEGRPLLAVMAVLALTLNVLALVFWCRPAIRDYLR